MARTTDVRAISLDQFWECPGCGFQLASGPPATLNPPTCGMGHKATEMEQVAAGRFGRQFEEGDDDA